jgi:RNA polymerase sigma-70 factor (ECF subfamily)
VAVPRDVEPAEPAQAPWSAIVRSHDRRVWLSLLALGLGPDRAREIAQTTWTRLIEKYGAEKLSDLQLPGLAIAQARFLALDDLRRTEGERRKLEPYAERVHAIADGTPSAEAQVMTREQFARALAELAALGPAAQKIFRLVYGDPPISQSDAAEKAGISVQRVRQTLTEVRKKIRRALEEE